MQVKTSHTHQLLERPVASISFHIGYIQEGNLTQINILHCHQLLEHPYCMTSIYFWLHTVEKSYAG